MSDNKRTVTYASGRYERHEFSTFVFMAPKYNEELYNREYDECQRIHDALIAQFELEVSLYGTAGGSC